MIVTVRFLWCPVNYTLVKTVNVQVSILDKTVSQFSTFCCNVRIILEYEVNCLIVLNILSPSLEQNITKSDIVFIKEPLFEYISERLP